MKKQLTASTFELGVVSFAPLILMKGTNFLLAFQGFVCLRLHEAASSATLELQPPFEFVQLNSSGRCGDKLFQFLWKH